MADAEIAPPENWRLTGLKIQLALRNKIPQLSRLAQKFGLSRTIHRIRARGDLSSIRISRRAGFPCLENRLWDFPLSTFAGIKRLSTSGTRGAFLAPRAGLPSSRSLGADRFSAKLAARRSTRQLIGPGRNPASGRRRNPPPTDRDGRHGPARSQSAAGQIHRSYTVDDAAQLFGCHRNTIRHWQKQGLKPIDGRRPSSSRV